MPRTHPTCFFAQSNDPAATSSINNMEEVQQDKGKAGRVNEQEVANVKAEVEAECTDNNNTTDGQEEQQESLTAEDHRLAHEHQMKQNELDQLELDQREHGDIQFMFETDRSMDECEQRMVDEGELARARALRMTDVQMQRVIDQHQQRVEGLRQRLAAQKQREERLQQHG
ncbi:hypothetical protein LTR08_006320 [Meristemomyces frigidus]|nr:hypothetical protein LTR08_006320 [Meristemomyces frigidus]